ncbi:hypothetical protein BESB_061070 [Besnoitia besnoiti]|uniref:Uncharacterized protein n=1 Tax=Besnoitia besnoiti TaxID=94643 RepID=A0A2A9MIJ2_BESBE|nr:hypothetical protein BESB_061070 [Besnoitia besnoiti]PFH35220.1 hypothetical protein BESB_061070 [Besnoitia besnoiti]
MHGVFALSVPDEYEDLLAEYREDQRLKKELEHLQGWQVKRLHPHHTIKTFDDLMLAPPPPEEGILLGGYVLEPVRAEDFNMVKYEPKAFYDLNKDGQKDVLGSLIARRTQLLNSMDAETLEALTKGAIMLGQVVEQAGGDTIGLSQAIRGIGEEARTVAASRAPEDSAGFVNLRTGLPCILSPDNLYCVATPTTTTTQAPPSLLELRNYKRRKEEEEEKRRSMELAARLEQTKRRFNPYDQPVYFDLTEDHSENPIEEFKKQMALQREKEGKVEEQHTRISSADEARTILRFARRTAQGRQHQTPMSEASMTRRPTGSLVPPSAATRYDSSSSKIVIAGQPNLDARNAAPLRSLVDKVTLGVNFGRPGSPNREFPPDLPEASMLQKRKRTQDVLVNGSHLLGNPLSAVLPCGEHPRGREGARGQLSRTPQDVGLVDRVEGVNDMHFHYHRYLTKEHAYSAPRREAQRHPLLNSREMPLQGTVKPDDEQHTHAGEDESRQPEVHFEPVKDDRKALESAVENKSAAFILEGVRQFQTGIQSARLSPDQLAKYQGGKEQPKSPSKEELAKQETDRLKRERQEQRVARLIENFTATSYAEELRRAALATGDPLPECEEIGTRLRASSLPPVLKEKVERTQQHRAQKKGQKQARQERERGDRQRADTDNRIQQLDADLTEHTLSSIGGYLQADETRSSRKSSRTNSREKAAGAFPLLGDLSGKSGMENDAAVDSTNNMQRRPGDKRRRAWKADGEADSYTRHPGSSGTAVAPSEQNAAVGISPSARVVWLYGDDDKNPFHIHPRLPAL